MRLEAQKLARHTILQIFFFVLFLLIPLFSSFHYTPTHIIYHHTHSYPYTQPPTYTFLAPTHYTPAALIRTHTYIYTPHTHTLCREREGTEGEREKPRGRETCAYIHSNMLSFTHTVIYHKITRGNIIRENNLPNRWSLERERDYSYDSNLSYRGRDKHSERKGERHRERLRVIETYSERKRESREVMSDAHTSHQLTVLTHTHTHI